MRVISDHDIGTDADDANIRHNYKHQHHKDPFNDDPEHHDDLFRVDSKPQTFLPSKYSSISRQIHLKNTF